MMSVYNNNYFDIIFIINLIFLHFLMVYAYMYENIYIENICFI